MKNKNLVLDAFSTESNVSWMGEVERGRGIFPDGRPSAAASGNISSDTLPSDWRGYGSLQFTIHSEWDRAAIGGICIYDQDAIDNDELDYFDFVHLGRQLLIGEGITHVVIDIDPIKTTRGERMLNLENVRRVLLSIPKPANGEAPLSISNLRLSSCTRMPDDVSGLKPGDTIMYIKHNDTNYYTHDPKGYTEPEDIVQLKAQLKEAMEEFNDMIRIADIGGRQTHYAKAVYLAAEIALKARSVLAWHFQPKRKRRNLTEALELVKAESQKLYEFVVSLRHDDDEDDSNFPLSTVKPIPDLSKLKISGNRFIGPDGRPVLICALDYVHEGAMMDIFAPDTHKFQLLAVGGGSRYDIDLSPVYDAYHKNSGTKRVGWRGWCGHLIRDQWSLGGNKDNILLCLESPHILEAIKEYNKEHVHDWIGLPQLAYIILAYELTYICFCDESKRRFRLWLAERHGNIETLNEKWNTNYSNFNEIEPPATEGQGAAPDVNRAAWFDWADWNMRRFTDHLKWAKEDIRQYHPTIPITGGASRAMFNPNIGTTGIDEELIAHEVSDVILQEGKHVIQLDFMNALTEYTKPLVDPEQGGDCSKWFINYLHGKSSIAMFWWSRQPSRQFPWFTAEFCPLHDNTSIPKLYEHFSTALDIRRLNEEITAFWDIPREIAILYSRTTMMQADPGLTKADKTPHLEALNETYEAARYLDAGITFVTERQLLAGKGGKFKLVVLPAVKFLPDNVFTALDEYVNAGGTVVLTPESLMADEYNRPQNYLSAWGITVKETFVPVIEGFGEAKQQYDQTMAQSVSYGKGKTTESVGRVGIADGLAIKTSGLFQYVECTGGEIAAEQDGAPTLIRISKGKGHIWYFAGTPEYTTLFSLLDRIYESIGIKRHVKVTDTNGNRVPGLEARLVRRRNDDLVYIANEGTQPAEFYITTDRPIDRVRELRSMEYYDKPTGILQPDECVLFALQENPKLRIERWGK